MKGLLIGLLMLFFCSTCFCGIVAKKVVMQSPEEFGKPTVTITVDSNVRETPNGTIVGVVTASETFIVSDVYGDYIKAKGTGRDESYNVANLEGWIYSEYASTGIVTQAVTVRTEPDKQGTVLGQFEVGTVITKVDTKATWYKIPTGWIWTENGNLTNVRKK